ncbi:hypothetical protein AB0M48_08060 [Lentzea sp. NPDC051208]|uniref:hypothetical protein n=1 Tax=Lentzea sp. NPDC051208 TaxID=3154642 RepID=UPI00344510E1
MGHHPRRLVGAYRWRGCRSGGANARASRDSQDSSPATRTRSQRHDRAARMPDSTSMP